MKQKGIESDLVLWQESKSDRIKYTMCVSKVFACFLLGDFGGFVLFASYTELLPMLWL